jgi:hypothetical protein
MGFAIEGLSESEILEKVIAEIVDLQKQLKKRAVSNPE